jgi:hypothetical protein
MLFSQWSRSDTLHRIHSSCPTFVADVAQQREVQKEELMDVGYGGSVSLLEQIQKQQHRSCDLRYITPHDYLFLYHKTYIPSLSNVEVVVWCTPSSPAH